MSYIIKKDELHSTYVCSANDGGYKIYKYKSPVSDHNLYKYRSIVEYNGNIVCFSPPKSLSQPDFCDLYYAKEYVAEEYIEGTMVNVFWDGNAWKTVSKSKMDADCIFFDTSISFKRMLAQTLESCGLVLNNLNKSYCYSFVMQHPENRIVSLFKIQQLYLIAAYEINRLDESQTKITTVNDIKDDPIWLTTTVKFPAKLVWDLKDKIPTNTPFTYMGVVFKNVATGDRCKLRNPAYEYVRQLRGNQPKLKYRYIELRKISKVGEYLTYYPEHAELFNHFKTQIHTFTNELFKLYVELNIKKSITLDTVDSKYRTALKKLHEHYKNVLKPQKMYLTRPIVIQFVNGLHEPIIMSLIR